MKSKKIILIALGAIVVVAVIIGGAFLWHNEAKAPLIGTNSSSTFAGYRNATYLIEGSSVTLIDGYAESELAPGSASKLVTRFFGYAATGDLAGNGTEDAAFLLTQSGGGSGTFYYVVAALNTPDGYKGTNAILLGDRIAPQSSEIRNGEVVVNYADRKPGEPMSAQPSVGVSKYFHVEGGTLIEVGR